MKQQVNVNALKANINRRGRVKFKYEIMKRNLNKLMPELPSKDECFKFISFSGGFASISFIEAVAAKEKILELTASTLRIGAKQFDILARLNAKGMLEKATFFVGTLMREDEKRKQYNYYGRIFEKCRELDWRIHSTNNHSKIILMRTEENYYVLETSSNLNENPKIEQFSIENNKGMYDFYYDFFALLGGGGDG